MSDYSGEQREAIMQSDNALGMVETQGWGDLARWVTEQARLECDAIERGAVSWDVYQRSVGRIEAYRKVLARPEELVELANQVVRGDSQ